MKATPPSHPRALIAALAGGLAFTPGLGVGVEMDSELLRSNRLGLQRLLAAEQTHGSLQSAALRVSLDVTCPEYRNPTQARTPDPPVESYSWSRRYLIDRPGGSESVHTRNEFAGFVFEDEILARNGRGLRLDHNTRTREPAKGTGFSVFHMLPQRYIKAALDHPQSVRLRRVADSGGHPADQVDMVEGGVAHSLFFDDPSGLLTRVDVLRHLAPYGDSVRSYRFEGRQTMAGLTIPNAVEVVTSDAVLGSTRNVFTMTLSSAGPGRSSPPATKGYAEADFLRRPPSSIKTLGAGIFLIENLTNSTGQWSYNVLFAEFEDHVLVAEAPVDDETTRTVVGRITSVVRNKPIRYLVQSHHHDDHLGGLRGYIARGARIVTTSGNAGLIWRIANAPHFARPDTLSREPREPQLEILKGGHLVLKDSQLEVHIFDVGPTAHANEMLVVYIPSRGVLFQSDLVNSGEFPFGADGAHFVAKVKELGLRVNVLAGVHGRTLSGGDLRKLGF